MYQTIIATILVATDGSEHAVKAVDLAADLATKYDARIVLHHVLLRDAALSDLYNLADVGSSPQAVQDELSVVEGAAAVATPMGGVYIPTVPRSVLEGGRGQIFDKARAAVVGQGCEECLARDRRWRSGGQDRRLRGTRERRHHRHGQPRFRRSRRALYRQRVAQGEPPLQLHLHHGEVAITRAAWIAAIIAISRARSR